MKQRWAELLNPKTFREWSLLSEFDGRNPFENDYGRLISSSSIRRLQDKTQVFPLEQSDFIRTRLTHSLEVSYIAGSLALSIEKYLLEKGLLHDSFKGHLSSLLRVGGLVHDLGNPPFGHFGEEAIKFFFNKYFNDNQISELNDQEKADFTHFNGNAQTLRILRRLHYFGDDYSFNLTYPSLASIIKYPSNSIEGNQGKDASEIAKRHFGYFASEHNIYNEINDTLKLQNRRHPVVYLLEAADDIAFCAADIEDGVKLGIICFEDIERVFRENLNIHESLNETLKKLYSDHKVNKNDKLNVIIQKFRVITQSIMIGSVINTFKDQYDSIIDGKLENEIIELASASEIRKAFKKLRNIVLENKKIMQTELAGWEAICGLLDIFVPAILSMNFEPEPNNKEIRLYRNISSSYRHIYEQYSDKYYPNKIYNKIQLIVDFIVGMTDSYTIDLYQKLKGIKI